MDINKIKLNAGSNLAYLTFLSALISNNQASFHNKTNKIIHFNAHASNYFLIGRDDKNVPFIGVQEIMASWFSELKWKKVIKSKNDRDYIYLLAEDNGIPINAIGLMIRPKRQIVIADVEKGDYKDKKVNMKICRIVNNEDIAISYNNVIDSMDFLYVDDICDIIKVEAKKENLDLDSDNGLILIKKNNKNSKNNKKEA